LPNFRSESEYPETGTESGQTYHWFFGMGRLRSLITKVRCITIRECQRNAFSMTGKPSISSRMAVTTNRAEKTWLSDYCTVASGFRSMGRCLLVAKCIIVTMTGRITRSRISNCGSVASINARICANVWPIRRIGQRQLLRWRWVETPQPHGTEAMKDWTGIASTANRRGRTGHRSRCHAQSASVFSRHISLVLGSVRSHVSGTRVTSAIRRLSASVSAADRRLRAINTELRDFVGMPAQIVALRC
jgi:hypothetical protein